MKEASSQRIIGTHEGEKHGPLIVVIGAMHGNEPAGVKAVSLALKMLEVEPITNPDFIFHGKMIGLIGNLRAFQSQKRYIDKDLNRLWTEERVNRLRTEEPDLSEESEIKELLDIIHQEIKNYKPTKLVILDLHTTSSYGGIFSVVSHDKVSADLALEFHAPVITGLTDILSGTSMHYFTTEHMGIDTVALTFESGQHEEPKAVNRAIAAIINLLRALGCVDEDCVKNIHDEILITFSKNLPEIADLLFRYHIEPNEDFIMRPGFKNFQRITEGETVADNQYGEIKAETDGLILMPLYQKQGNDGFFIVG